MEVYSENLKETFGEFHVLVRPSNLERARRLGYRGLEGVEKVKASPATTATVNSFKTLASKAREAVAEIQGHYRGEQDPQRSSVLPETVATEPLSEVSADDREAEELSKEVFEQGKPESLADFGARIMGSSTKSSFYIAPLNREELDSAIALMDLREAIRKAPPRKREDKLRSYRAAASRRVVTAKAQAQLAMRSGAVATRRKLSSTGYTVRASASLAAEATTLKSRAARAKVQSGGKALKRRAARMSIPAGHIRPGDTFDGTTVRAVESLDDGRVKISYQAAPGGPILATTVASDRSMGIDRKTRREARNSRISSKVAKPVAQTRELSRRVVQASTDQLNALGTLRGSEVRFGSIERAIRQQERDQRQRELIDRLKALRSRTSERVLQRS